MVSQGCSCISGGFGEYSTVLRDFEGGFEGILEPIQVVSEDFKRFAEALQGVSGGFVALQVCCRGPRWFLEGFGAYLNEIQRISSEV